MSNLIQEAVLRVEGFLKNYESEYTGEILADIMHYCRERGLDFQDELNRAEGYVDEELSMMEMIKD